MLKFVMCMYCGLLFLPCIAVAESWKSFIPDDKTGSQIIQYDVESKKKVSDNVTRVWVKSEAKEQTDKKGASPVARSFYLIETNCQERMYRILSTAEYARDGRLMGSSNAEDAPWYHIVPESTVSYLHRVLCQR